MSAARQFVRERLRALGADGACDDAGTLVSEIATNAVLHARTPFTVEVTRDGLTVRVCVLDLSPVMPRARAYGAEATTGRGMRLIASLASDWGVQVQGQGRKTVWFELPAAGNPNEAPAWEDGVVDVAALLAGFDDDSGDAAPAAPRAAA